jgi:hypothetical protein
MGLSAAMSDGAGAAPNFFAIRLSGLMWHCLAIRDTSNY